MIGCDCFRIVFRQKSFIMIFLHRQVTSRKHSLMNFGRPKQTGLK